MRKLMRFLMAALSVVLLQYFCVEATFAETPISNAVVQNISAGVPVPKSGPARIYSDTDLVKDGKPAAVFVFSGTDAAAADIAGQLALALKKKFGIAFLGVSDTALCANVMTRLPDEYRAKNLIVVGNLHNNRVLFPLYASFLCGADCEFPGDAGYELRTISNPWGTGKNVLLIGGSTVEGLKAGMETFLAKLPVASGTDVIVPRLHMIKPGKAIKSKLDKINERAPTTPFKPPAQAVEATSGMFWGPAMNYHWTGEEKWAERAREALLYFNEIYTGCYLNPGEHYTAEAFFRAWDLIEEAPVFSESERQTIARRMLETFWRWNHGGAGGSGGGIGHLGNTHGTMIAMSQWTALRYLQRAFWDDAGLLKRLAVPEKVLRSYYQAAFGGYLDDGSGIPSFQSFVRWSAMEQEPAYLESDYARQGLLYATVYYDSLGFAPGIGTYGDARPGAMRSRASYWCEAYLFRLAAFIYGDAELAFLGNLFSGYGPVDVWPVMYLSRYGAGSYPPLPGMAVKPPVLAGGLSVVPFDQRRYRLWNIGAPTRGVPLDQRMPILECMFDKVCFRSGYEQEDQYLLLQGILSGSRDANTIARYTDRGEIWLTHNSGQEGHFVRNGIFISDGLNDRQIQSGCRLDAAGRFDDLSMISSTLLDFYESNWQRVVFWKPKNWFVVFDRAILSKAGQYSVQSIWRLPSVPGVWDADAQCLTVSQNGKIFSIQGGEKLPASAQFEMPEGGMPDVYENPFVLRQYKSGFYAARRILDFQNLLTVADGTKALAYKLMRINDSAGLVQSADGEICLFGVGGPGTGVLGLDADGGVFVLTPDAIYLAGVRMLRLDGESVLDAPRPVSARIDLKTGVIKAGYDQEQLREAASTWKLKAQNVSVSGWPKEKVTKIAKTLQDRLTQTVDGFNFDANRLTLDAQRASGGAGRVEREAMVKKEQGDGLLSLKMVWESSEAGLRGKPPEGLEVKQIVGADRGDADMLINRIIPGQGEGIHWPESKAEVTLGWRNPEAIAEIIMHVGSAARRGKVAQRIDGDRKIELEWSSDGFQNDLRKEAKLVNGEIRMDPTYKGEVTASKYLPVPCGGVLASGVRLIVPRSANDLWSGIAVSEIEVLTTNRGPLGIEQLLVADLGSGNEPSIILTTEDRQLVVLGSDGKKRWNKQFVGRVPSVFVADINGDGKQEILCCSYDMNVYAFAADGRELWQTSCVDLFKKTGGKTGLNGSTPFAVGFWEPRPGLRRIAVGQYASRSVLLDETGAILDFAGLGGYTPRVYFGQADLNGDGLEELCMSSILYKGAGNISIHVVDHNGKPGKSGAAVIPSGRPFVAQLLKERSGYAAIIAPGGVGVYNLNMDKEKRAGSYASWESRSRPLAAGLLHDIDGDGNAEILAGGRDGFITVYSLDGIPLKIALIGEDVKGILAFGFGKDICYIVSTPCGLRIYDENWTLIAKHADNYARLAAFDMARRTFIAVTDDARIQMWELHNKKAEIKFQGGGCSRRKAR